MEKKEKRKNRRREHGLVSNYWFLYKGFLRLRRWHILMLAMILVGSITIPYVYMYTSKETVSLVMGRASVPELIGTLALLYLAICLLEVLEQTGYGLLANQGLKYRHVLEEKMLDKICRTAYSDLENPEYKEKLAHAQQLYLHWDRDARSCIWASLSVLVGLVKIPVTAGLLMTLHPVVAAVLLAGTFLQHQVGKLERKWEEKYRDFWEPLERKMQYIVEKLMDFSNAKDMRLYAAGRWLLPKYGKLMEERRRWMRKQWRQTTAASCVYWTIEAFKQAGVYGFLIYSVLEGTLQADDFVLYLGLAMSFSGDLDVMVGNLRELRTCELSIADYRKMMEMPDSKRDSGEVMEHPVGRAPGITFSHVSFAYPEAGADTLKDVDVHVRPGEKVALVGLNGAGKTTLVKLLCGLYEPTGGEILLDGKPAAKWELESWYKLFSVVFQDIGVLPGTIVENVAACAPEEADRGRVRSCLEQAGLWESVEKLPQGMDTYLRKDMFQDGTEFSGGETQKLLLARAIYKEAPVLVLDEPTAALDAIAENRLYLRYNELTKGRTSLFISHRLSSTRFCDTIWMLQDGRIVEQGSHTELMARRGAYYELFQVQSHYYQNDRKEGFSSELDPAWEVAGYVSD